MSVRSRLAVLAVLVAGTALLLAGGASGAVTPPPANGNFD
jgi:hypothetical protein